MLLRIIADKKYCLSFATKVSKLHSSILIFLPDRSLPGKREWHLLVFPIGL